MKTVLQVPSDLLAFIAGAIAVAADGPYDIPDADYNRIIELADQVQQLSQGIPQVAWFEAKYKK